MICPYFLHFFINYCFLTDIKIYVFTHLISNISLALCSSIAGRNWFLSLNTSEKLTPNLKTPGFFRRLVGLGLVGSRLLVGSSKLRLI